MRICEAAAGLKQGSSARARNTAAEAGKEAPRPDIEAHQLLRGYSDGLLGNLNTRYLGSEAPPKTVPSHTGRFMCSVMDLLFLGVTDGYPPGRL